MKVTSLCVFVVKNHYLGFFFTLRIFMVDTSLYSKMVRKVKLVCVDIDLKTAPEKRRFPGSESQNKPSLAETVNLVQD